MGAHTWTTKAPIPTERQSLALAEVGGKLEAIGGYNGGCLNMVEELSLGLTGHILVKN